MYRKPVVEKSADTSDDEPDIDIAKLLKDVELFGNCSTDCLCQCHLLPYLCSCLAHISFTGASCCVYHYCHLEVRITCISN